MKLNIEELAREANLSYLIGIGDDDETRMYYGAWPEQLKAFASLIVERCAVECDELFDERAAGGFPREASSARTLSIRIRNLLED